MNHDAITTKRTQSGKLAVYLGNRRVGTIIEVRGAAERSYAYVPAGLTEHTGRTFPSEYSVVMSLHRSDEDY